MQRQNPGTESQCTGGNQSKRRRGQAVMNCHSVKKVLRLIDRDGRSPKAELHAGKVGGREIQRRSVKATPWFFLIFLYSPWANKLWTVELEGERRTGGGGTGGWKMAAQWRRPSLLFVSSSIWRHVLFLNTSYLSVCRFSVLTCRTTSLAFSRLPPLVLPPSVASNKANSRCSSPFCVSIIHLLLTPGSSFHFLPLSCAIQCACFTRSKPCSSGERHNP